MGLFQLFLFAVGLSMDAFAVSICTGLGMRRVTWQKSATVGAYFGGFQALMPLIGYFMGLGFADLIRAYDHWVALGMLALIGGKMVHEGLEKPQEAHRCPAESPLGPRKMLPLAVATSIDALAVGISLALLDVNIGQAAALIGVTTFCLSAAGVYIGKAFGLRFKSKAEIFGGVVLILIGIKIALEHTGIIAF